MLAKRAKKGAVGLSLSTIIAVIMVVIIALAVGGVWLRIFTGQQVTAFNTIVSEINNFCEQSSPQESSEFFIVMPDSIGKSYSALDPEQYEFFYVASVPTATARSFLGIERVLSGNVLVLASRKFSTQLPNDVKDRLQIEILGTKVDLSLFLPPVRIIKAAELNECFAERNLKLCGCIKDPCDDPSNVACTPTDSFSFESQEGRETLNIKLFRGTDRVTMTIDRVPICGDFRCCGPQEDALSCANDCDPLRNPDIRCEKITA